MTLSAAPLYQHSAKTPNQRRTLPLPPGAVHETGHALYEQGRNLSEDWKDLPVNSVRATGPREGPILHVAYCRFWTYNLWCAALDATLLFPTMCRPCRWASMRARACCGSAWWR